MQPLRMQPKKNRTRVVLCSAQNKANRPPDCSSSHEARPRSCRRRPPGGALGRAARWARVRLRADTGGDIRRYVGGEGGADLDAAKVQIQGRFGKRRHHALGGPAAWHRFVGGDGQDFVGDVESVPEPKLRGAGRVAVGRGGDEVHGPPALPRRKE